MIKVLVVDDSLVQQELLTYILNSDPDITVVGSASNGEEAIRKVAELKPNIVTMDVNMPKMNGIEAIRILMTSNPLPVIVISSSNTKQEVSNSFLALEAGAVSVLERTIYSPESINKLIKTVKLMSDVKVIKRHERLEKQKVHSVKQSYAEKLAKIDLIAIGASTGGPQVLKQIIQNLSMDFPPILVVQHISEGFLEGLTDWLAESTKTSIKIASHNEEYISNHIYLAPDGFHMGIAYNKITLTSGELLNGHRPSVSYLFRSIANVKGKNALGILLTGMGNDGADGLKELKEAGSFTIAQDKETSVIYGMPNEALMIDAVNKVLNPIEIAEFINSLSKKTT